MIEQESQRQDGKVPRRRREDRESGETTVSRHRELFRKLREPLIGLTLAGAAAPLITDAATTKKGTNGAGEASKRAQQASGTVAAGAEVEEAVNQRWAEAEAVSAREQFIEGAVVRYGIGRDLADDIFEEAERAGIEPDLAFGLVNTESTFRERAVSYVGARGLTQVMPRTASWLDPTVSAADLFDRKTNLRVGFKYLNQLIDKYDGNVRNALLAYNRGPGTVDKILKRGGNPDNGYADKVLNG